MNDDRNNRNRVLEKAMPDIRASIREPVISGLNIYSIYPPIDK